MVVDPSGPPVFVLAGGARSGSTLLQRMLISTGEIMIWGEHGGLLLDGLQRMVAGMAQWIEAEGARHFERFTSEGWNRWIPNVNPPHDAFVEGARAALLRSLAVPAAELGYPRWGFKEIRYTAGAVELLKMLFPDAPIIVLVRNPEAALRSIKSTAFYEKDYQSRPEVFLSRWATASLSLARTCIPGSSVRLWRFEDVVADPEAAITSLAAHVAIDAGRFDRAAIQTRIRGVPGAVRSDRDSEPDADAISLDQRDRAALAAAEVRDVAAQLGYGQ
ncbi:MAG TPA: sulfotransferase [Casimicrobiaceae bacterium]|nr:sulfotransferase [Casimicrobiaceae bacterium]